MSYGTDAPAYWGPSFADDGSSMLEQEQCIIKAEHFFIRGRISTLPQSIPRQGYPKS